MTNSVKGEVAIEILRRPEIAKEFVNSDNPVSKEVIYGLQSWFLNNQDIHQIEKVAKEDGSTAAGATLHKCLIQCYSDQPEKFTLEQFIEVLDNCRTNVKLSTMLRSICNSITFQATKSGSTLAFDQKLSLIINKLRGYYKKRFGKYQPSPLAEPFSIADVWVNLSLSKGLSKVKSVEYLESLKQAYQEDQLSLLIGQAGEGKTMTMKRLAYDWATDKLSDYDLVLCVPLRDIEESSGSILDMALQNLQHYGVLKDSDVSYLQTLRDSMIGEPKMSEQPSNQVHVLIILDGYDELNSNVQCQQLTQLLFNRDLLNLDYCVLLTSRPYAIEDVRTPAPKLFIEPLDQEQQAKYMFQHFKEESLNDPTARVKKLKNLLAQNPSLQEPAKTPLLLCFICILSNVLTPTDGAVQLYKLLFNAMVDRYETAITIGNVRNIIPNLHEVFKKPFPNICSQSRLVYNLGRMALTGLVGDSGHTHDKLQFTENDLDNFEVDKDICTKVGFLNVQFQGFGRKIYEFPHKTMQEVFAALLLIHEISNCSEIVISEDQEKSYISLFIENRSGLFQHHPLFNQVFVTTKDWALEQFYSFLLEMSADSQETHNIYQLVNNTISFFLAWTYRGTKATGFLSPSMFRALLKQLPNCSDKSKFYLRRNLANEIWNYYDSEFLLLHLSTCNIQMYSLEDGCFYVPDLETLVIMDKSSIDHNLLSHAIPISYDRLRTKCDRDLWLCLVDLAAWHFLFQVCQAVMWKEIIYMKVNMANLHPSNSESLSQKILTDSVTFKFEENVKSPFNFMPFWNDNFLSLFTDIKQIKMKSLGNDLLVNGLDQICSQLGVQNSVKTLRLDKIAFRNEETVVRLAEQLKQFKSLEAFRIWNVETINEQSLLALLDGVKEAGASDFTITEGCLQQRETFLKFCSCLQQWHNLCYLSFGETFLSLSFIDILCDTVSQLHHLKRLFFGSSNEVNEKHINQLKQTNPTLRVIHD